MSHSVDEPPDDPRARPRPSWGQPGPEPAEPTVVAPGSRSGAEPDVALDRSGPSYGQPSYGQPGQQPYGSPAPATGGSREGASSWPPPPGAPPAWPQQGWGQPDHSAQPYGQPPGWSQPGPPPGWGQPTPSQYGQDLGRHEQAYAQMYGEKPRTGMSVAAMVLGILAALFALFPVGSYVAIPLALLAVIFGIVGIRRQAGRGMAVTGLVLGGLALVVAIVASVFWTRFFVDVVQIATDCEDQTGRASGPAFEDCVDERSRDLSPFG